MYTELELEFQERNVLVLLEDYTREVKLILGSVKELKEAIFAEFSDVLQADSCSLFLKRKDDSWGGLFVDLKEEEIVKDRSIIKALVVHTVSSKESSWQSCV